MFGERGCLKKAPSAQVTFAKGNGATGKTPGTAGEAQPVVLDPHCSMVLAPFSGYGSHC